MFVCLRVFLVVVHERRDSLYFSFISMHAYILSYELVELVIQPMTVEKRSVEYRIMQAYSEVYVRGERVR